MFKKKLLAAVLWPLALVLMISTIAHAQYATPKFDMQGHRGARGLMPENTIPAFLLALDSGVTTLELDLAVTSDNKLVVSHEPWMNHLICFNPSGQPIDSVQAMRANIFQMTYNEVKLWDCGSKGNARFPEQQKMKVAKPLLVDVIAAVEAHIKSYTRYEVDYNIEIKSAPQGDNVYHPAPKAFADLVIQTLNQYLPMERVVIQSFDFRVLQYIHQQYPAVKLAALVENVKSIDANLKDLGFIPDIYSPYWKFLNEKRVHYLHTKKPTGAKNGTKLRVIPWTVNDIKDMKALIKMGVDGLITDYPNRAKSFVIKP
jgi:glycerophosphoryl diester phosphodiesterase